MITCACARTCTHAHACTHALYLFPHGVRARESKECVPMYAHLVITIHVGFAHARIMAHHNLPEKRTVKQSHGRPRDLCISLVGACRFRSMKTSVSIPPMTGATKPAPPRALTDMCAMAACSNTAHNDGIYSLAHTCIQPTKQKERKPRKATGRLKWRTTANASRCPP